MAFKRKQQYKYSIDDMRALAKDYQGKCLSDVYISARNRLRWRCQHGHEWMASFASVTKEWCPVCAVEKRKIERREKQYRVLQQIAKERKGQCLSTVDDYQTSRGKLLWRCHHGHEWWAAPEKIKYRTWCPTCADKARADKTRLRKYADMQRIAKERGGKCLLPAFTGVYDKMLWECAEGHQWWAMPVRVQDGTWCRQCFAASRRTTLKEIKGYARQKGGRCLSRAIEGSNSVASFECEQGHQWEATVNNVMNGTWCPTCGYIEGTKKRRIHTYDTVASLVKARGGVVLSPASDFQNLRSRLKFQCDQGHRWEKTAQSVVDGYWCPRCSPVGRKTLADMQAIAKAKGGECLSTEYIDSQTKYHWRCAEGHEWEATYRSANQGWCRVCKNRSPRAPSNWNKYTLDTMHHIAEKLGWQVVSKRYNGTLKPLKWRCDKGHEFSMLPRNVLQKTSCPICNPRKHTLNEMQVVAKERGGQCLSKVYENVNTKMRWRCQHGHEWDALPSSILQGAWCRECRKTTVAKAQTARRINNQKKRRQNRKQK